MTGRPAWSTAAAVAHRLVPDLASPPWRAPAAGVVDRAEILTWQSEVESQHAELRRRIEREFGQPEPARLTPGISVVVVAGPGAVQLERCLQSVAAQTLDPGLFEVVVVGAEPSDRQRTVIEQFRSAHPSATVRGIHLNRGGAERACDAGAAAASREYTTFVDARDTISPPFLSVLLECAAPRVVPVAPVVTPGPAAAHPAPAGPAGDSPLGDLGAAAATRYGKVIATRLARAVRYDRGLAAADLAYWAAAAVDGQARFRPTPPGSGAAYHRAAAVEPAGRPAMTLEQAVRGIDLVVDLERLAGAADPSTGELLRAAIETEAELIGDYLGQHPSDHPTLVTALDRSPVFHLPYQRMNRRLDRGLVVAYAFPPYSDASGIVMAKRIRTRGRVADVVYNAMDRKRKLDQTTRRISGPYTCDEAAIPTPTHFSFWPSMEKFTVDGLAKVQEWAAIKGPYKWLYSRAHFAASHLLAARYKLANPAVTWTAEFSDPLSRGRLDEEQGTPIEEGLVTAELRAGLRRLGLPVPDSKNCLVWCEEVSYALADELIFTNENQLAYMLSYCSDRALAAMAREKAVVSPHPTLSSEFYTMLDANYPLADGVAHLAYFGVFYATRGLDDVLTALAGLDPQTRRRLQVHVFTTEPAPLRERAASLGIEESVRVGGYVGYLEFLNLTTRFDCLLVNDAATREYHQRNPYLPSKWSDYKGSGTPVWGLVEDGSPLSRQPLEYASRVGDIIAAREVLSRIVRRKMTE